MMEQIRIEFSKPRFRVEQDNYRFAGPRNIRSHKVIIGEEQYWAGMIGGEWKKAPLNEYYEMYSESAQNISDTEVIEELEKSWNNFLKNF